jgi:hypothetical protein
MPDPLLGRSVCAAGQPACPQVSRYIGLSEIDREFPRVDRPIGHNRHALASEWGCPALTDRADNSVRLHS